MGAEYKRNTIPATRAAMTRSEDRESSTVVSGVRPAVEEPSPSDHAHAEMERAIARGTCTIVSQRTGEDGTIVQWSAWLLNGHLVCQAWFRPVHGHWSRGPSFVVDATAVERLKLVLEHLPVVEGS